MDQPVLKRRLTPLDATFLYVESDKTPMHIGSIMIFKGRIPYKRFVTDMKAKITHHPRYLQRMVPTPLSAAHPSWEDDPEFDISKHIILHRLGAPGTFRRLRNLAEKLQSTVLDRAKPLWELHLVHGLERGQSALITKVHHCLADGISGVDLTYAILDRTPDAPRTDAREFSPDPIPPKRTLLYEGIVDDFIQEVEGFAETKQSLTTFRGAFSKDRFGATMRQVGKVVGRATTSPNRMPFNVHRLSGHRRIGMTKFSFAEIRAMRTALGGTVNDIILTVLSGAVRRYVKKHGKKADRMKLRVAVPVSIRLEEERGAMGNRVTMLPVQIPLGITDNVKRLQHINDEMQGLKESHVADGIYALFRFSQGLPPGLQAAVGRLSTVPKLTTALATLTAWPIVNLVCTNVPGPQIPLYTLGRELTGWYPFLPVVAEVAVSVGILSYNQHLHITVISDRAAMPDVDFMMRCMDETYESLRKRAQVDRMAPIPIHREKRVNPPSR